MRRTFAALVAAPLLAGCGAGHASEDNNPASNRNVTTFDNSTPYPARVKHGEGTRPRSSEAMTTAAKPSIVNRPIPFPQSRKTEMAAYASRHYGFDTYRLRSPHVIVEHYTETTTFEAAYSTFAADVRDSELHELPGTCAHFIVDRDGTIYELVPLTVMCRHTVGLNWTAIGIEHVGMSDADVMGDKPQLQASLRLTRWLRCRFGIDVPNVIGHNESLSSPYHRENVAALRTQTHADMQRPTMVRYRRRLSALGC